MSNDNVTTILAIARFFVTLTGVINPAADNGGIGPSIATVTITQTVRGSDGVACSPSYSVAFDGHHQCGGFAAHLRGDWLAAFDGLAIAHEALSVEVLDEALPVRTNGVDITAFAASHGPVTEVAPRPAHPASVAIAALADAGLVEYIAATLAIRQAIVAHGADSDEWVAAADRADDAWAAFARATDRAGQDTARRMIAALHGH